MTGTEILVTAGRDGADRGACLVLLRPETARRAEVRAGVQEVEINVKGGYSRT